MSLVQFGRNGITKDTMIVATKEQVHSELDGETVILHFVSGTYYGLNSVGTFVWDMLRQPRQVAEILAEMLDRFDVDSNQCEADLIALLCRLSDERLIEVLHAHDA